MRSATIPLIVGISGTPGTLYGVRLLQMLRQIQRRAHLIVAKAARRALKVDAGASIDAMREMTERRYSNGKLEAAVASGLYQTRG